MALNPEEPLPESLVCADPGWRLHWMLPLDVVEQFTAGNDAVADEILELGVRAIVDGAASPDQDWRPWWSQAIATTAGHFAEGKHGTRRPS